MNDFKALLDQRVQKIEARQPDPDFYCLDWSTWCVFRHELRNLIHDAIRERF